MTDVPIILLGHRNKKFLPSTLTSLRGLAGTGPLVIVDDSGDPEHHRWLDNQGLSFTVVDPCKNSGYLAAMQVVWQVAEAFKAPHFLFWEEDFQLTAPVDIAEITNLLDRNQDVAQINLQRQAVYGVERRFGYMESHQQRGYNLTVQHEPDGTHWVKRKRPFTTNPGVIRSEILPVSWPSPDAVAHTDGGAEVAMSHKLEAKGWHFGWYGRWDTPSTMHLGVHRKTGIGY